MVLMHKFDKAEKKAIKIKNQDEKEIIRKYSEEINKESESEFIPPLPTEAFKNSQDLLTNLLKDIYKNNNFSLDLIQDKNNIFIKKNKIASSFKNVIQELLTLKNYLLPKSDEAKKDQYCLKVSEDKCTLCLTIDISHIKTNSLINKFIQNYSPKIQLQLIDYNGYIETERTCTLNNKTQFLKIEIKYFIAGSGKTNSQIEM